jgi:hypothetical protein
LNSLQITAGERHNPCAGGGGSRSPFRDTSCRRHLKRDLPHVAVIYVTFHISIEDFLPLTPQILGILRCDDGKIDDREIDAGIDGWIERQIDGGGRTGELSPLSLSPSLPPSLLSPSLSLALCL